MVAPQLVSGLLIEPRGDCRCRTDACLPHPGPACPASQMASLRRQTSPCCAAEKHAPCQVLAFRAAPTAVRRDRPAMTGRMLRLLRTSYRRRRKSPRPQEDRGPQRTARDDDIALAGLPVAQRHDRPDRFHGPAPTSPPGRGFKPVSDGIDAALQPTAGLQHGRFAAMLPWTAQHDRAQGPGHGGNC